MQTAPKELTYKVIEKEILRRILEGVYAPGQQMPTERELEKELEVSRLTIAKGLANLAAAGYITRTQGRGSFVCPRLPMMQRALGPKSTNHGIIKFISPVSPPNQVVVRRGVLEGIHAGAAAAGYHVCVEFYESVEQQLALLERYQDPINEGFVIWPAHDTRILPVLRRMQSANFPFALVDSIFTEITCDYIVSDNIYGAELMVNHLVEAGHRRIAYFTAMPDRTSLAERLAGVIAALSKNRLPVLPETINVIPGDDAITAGYKGAQNLDYLRERLQTMLAMKEPPTAIFAGNDFIAMAIYNLLEEFGVRVPEQMALAGFDNIDAAQYFKIPLTTVAQDFFGLGQMAGKVIMERRASTLSRDMYLQSRMAPELIVRESTKGLK